MEEKIDWKKYLIVFLITLSIFLVAFSISNIFSNKKVNQLKDIQDNIFIDLLSSETKYSLLGELSCKDIDQSFLSRELNQLAEKIEYSEQNINISSDEILRLKNYYFLLEIKDYLLMKKIGDRCNIKPIFVLYFYGNKEDCPECQNQSLVLTSLREKIPDLRVYSFDYKTDLAAIESLKGIFKVEGALPALVIDGKSYNGFKTIEDIEKISPMIKKMIAENKKKIETEAKTKEAETKKQ